MSNMASQATLGKHIVVDGGVLETTVERVAGWWSEWVVCLRCADGHIYTLTRGACQPNDSQAIRDAQARILRLWLGTQESR